MTLIRADDNNNDENDDNADNDDNDNNDGNDDNNDNTKFLVKKAMDRSTNGFNS